MKGNASIGFRDLVDGFLFSLRAEGKSNGTVEYYTYLLNPLLSYASKQGWPDSVASLDTHRLRELLTWTATRTFELKVCNNGGKTIKKAKPSTAWPYFRALRRLLNWAVEEGYLESSPLANIRFKQPPAPPVEGYSRDELQRLLAVCDLDIRTGARFTGTRNKGMLLLFVDSGLRRAELANLKLNDLDLENRRIRVLGKGNKIGIVPFSPKTAKALWAWLILRKSRAKTDRLWTTEEGEAFSIEGLVTWFKRLKKRAGVNTPGGVHRLRHTSAPTPSSPLKIADAPAGLPVSADVNLLPYGEGRLEEFRNPKYLAATEGCLHISTAISLPEGKTISLTLESDCPIDWYGDWDNPSPKIGIQFPQMRTYTEDSGWVTICSGAMETRQILASNEGKRLEVILTVHPDNSGASVSNIYKLFAVNFDLDSPHYLKYSISYYTAASLSPELEPMLGVEIREVKIHSYRSSYDAEGKVDPNFIEATFSWKTNKPCFYWFEIKPVDSENPYNSSSPQPYDTSRPLVQQVEHEITIILKPGGFHTYTLVIWDTEKNSARREALSRLKGFLYRLHRLKPCRALMISFYHAGSIPITTTHRG